MLKILQYFAVCFIATVLGCSGGINIANQSGKRGQISSPIIKAPEPDEIKKPDEIKEVLESPTAPDSMYYAEKAPGYYFVLERVIDDKDFEKWSSYLKNNTTVRESIRKPLTDKWGILHAKNFTENFLQKMAFATFAVENDAQRVLDDYKDAEVWMAYITDVEPKYKFSASKNERIEMSVVVVSKMGSPFQVHMGILRGLEYIRANKEIHNNTSIDLHGFIAKTMTARDRKKVYVVTHPLDSMSEIFRAKLDKKHIRFYNFGRISPFELGNPNTDPWIVKTGDNARADDFSLKVFKPDGTKIFALKKGDKALKDKYRWLFEHVPFRSGTLHFIGELAYLASKFMPAVDERKP